MLSTDVETKDEDRDNPVSDAFPPSIHFPNCAVQKVTISTCHSAKGLEWPVVFVPAGELPGQAIQPLNRDSLHN